jgi:hypothetical protein
MVDDPAPRRLADVVRSGDRESQQSDAVRAIDTRRADELVRVTHEMLCALVASAAAELRNRQVSSDTGRFTPTGRGWKLPGVGMWIAWDGTAYTTSHDAPAGVHRQIRFDTRRVPRTLFQLPSWIPEEGGTRCRVIAYGEKLIVSPGGKPFQPVLGAAVDERARRG